MRFDEILAKFLKEIDNELDVSDGVIKIAVTPELFEKIVIELSKKKTGYPYLTDLGELKIFNVQIVARRRDDF